MNFKILLLFNENEEQDSAATGLCALRHQLFPEKPQFIHYDILAWGKVGEKLAKEVLELWRILLAAARDDRFTM